MCQVLPAVTMNLLLEMAQWDALDSLKLFMHSTGKNIIHSVKKKCKLPEIYAVESEKQRIEKPAGQPVALKWR